MKHAYPDNPDAAVQAEGGVMFAAPEREPLFLEIDKRAPPCAQLVYAALLLLQWIEEARALRDGDTEQPIPDERVGQFLRYAGSHVGDAFEELEGRGILPTQPR